MRNRWVVLLAAITLLAFPSCALFALSAAQRAGEDGVRIEQDLRPLQPSRIAELVDRVLSSVVNVRVTSAVSGGEEKGEGSGVIIDESGIVLTNAHVVENAVSVEVAFAHGEQEVEGRVIGAIGDRDLAVVKIPPGDLTAIEVGSSEQLRLGDEVIAIGYPLGLGGPTVTKGIISGKAREIDSETPGGTEIHLRGLLQTDAAINPGNSGGPLLDMAGRLIGINTAVAGFAENTGFAIAIDDALPTIEEIMSNREEPTGWLGVQTQLVTPAIAAELGLPSGTDGVVVVNVFPNTPAAEAGLEEGDVLLAAAGRRLNSRDALSDVITEHRPGDLITLVVATDGDTETVHVHLGIRPVTVPTP